MAKHPQRREHTTNLKDQLGGLKFERSVPGDKRLARVVSVARSRTFREHQGKILLEGRHLICNALAAGANPQMVFFSSVDTLCELPLDKLKRATLVKVKFEDIKIWSDLCSAKGSDSHIFSARPIPADIPSGPLHFRRRKEMAASLRVPWKICSILFFYVLFLTSVPQVILGFITYSREELLNIRLTSTHHRSYQEYDFPETDPVFCLPPNTMDLIPAGDPVRRRKRGKRGGLVVRLRRRAHRTPLPSILLANVQSLDNKVDEIRARVAFQRDIRDCNVLCFTETWLTQGTLTESVQPAGFFMHRADRNKHLSGPWAPSCTVLSLQAATMSCSPRAVWMLGNLRCCEQRWVPISAFVFPSLDWDDIQNQLPKSVTVQVADNCSSYEREIAENMEANQSNKPSKAGDFGWVSSRPNCKDMHYEEYQSDSKLSLPRAETKLYHEGWAWEHRPCDWWRDSWTESGSRTIG